MLNIIFFLLLYLSKLIYNIISADNYLNQIRKTSKNKLFVNYNGLLFLNDKGIKKYAIYE